jgi:hypothetical protein
MGTRAGSRKRVVSTRRLVPLPADTLAMFLGEVRNQLAIADTVRAPLGLRRSVHVGVPECRERPDVVVPVHLGGTPLGRVRWSFEPLPAVTGVELALELEASARVRTFLRLGGRRWLERRLAEMLCALADVALVAAA